MNTNKQALGKPEAPRELGHVEPLNDRAFLLRQYRKNLYKSSQNPKFQRNKFIFVGVGIFIFALFFTITNIVQQKTSEEELDAIRIKLETFDEQTSILRKELEAISHSLKRQEKITQDFFSNKNNPSPALRNTPLYPKKEIILDSKQRYHEVCPGDTLYRIAKHYRIPIDALFRLNHLSPSQPIYPGQKILIHSGG